MKKLILIIFLFTVSGIYIEAWSQTYKTESKSCGSCHKKVSNNSKIGMYCPHCRVRWGYENESRTTSYNIPSYGNYDSYKSSGMTSSNVNLRASPSTKSRIRAVIPSYTSLAIISRTENWYYVEYSYFNGYSVEKIRGYVYKTLI